MIELHNTLSGKDEPFHSLKPGEIRLYTCGPTVYDYAHIGNFRAYLFEDLLKRFFIFKGYRVIQVMNITDVDDKTIRGAAAEGISLEEYTRRYIDSFFRDIETLNILKADHYPRATEHIREMAALAKGLVEKGYAYEKDGSLYFSVSRFPAYGALSKINRDELKVGVRVEADEYEKENAQDFALWKKRKEGEPSWETEVGTGRPGWHIECSAMSMKYLGETFDIHCGGIDNIFPHHENEIAQSEAYTGKKFVRYWLHCHHLIVDGEKMSKSKGNQYTLKDILERNTDPLALRFLFLSTHYRKMLNFTFDALHQAQASLQRIRDFLYELEHRTFGDSENKEILKLIKSTEKKFTSGLEDDLNISLSLSVLFELVRKVNILISEDRIGKKDAQKLISLLHSLDAVLGVLPPKEEEELPLEIREKIEEREKARREKRYDAADKIRDELMEKGITLEDTPEGVRWKVKKNGLTRRTSDEKSSGR